MRNAATANSEEAVIAPRPGAKPSALPIPSTDLVTATMNAKRTRRRADPHPWAETDTGHHRNGGGRGGEDGRPIGVLRPFDRDADDRETYGAQREDPSEFVERAAEQEADDRADGDQRTGSTADAAATPSPVIAVRVRRPRARRFLAGFGLGQWIELARRPVPTPGGRGGAAQEHDQRAERPGQQPSVRRRNGERRGRNHQVMLGCVVRR